MVQAEVLSWGTGLGPGLNGSGGGGGIGKGPQKGRSGRLTQLDHGKECGRSSWAQEFGNMSFKNSIRGNSSFYIF